MAANAGILIGWDRARAGREAAAVGGFGEWMSYVQKLQAEKQIDSFEPVMLNPHGGDLNGFTLIRGERAKLNQLRESDQFKDWVSWGAFNLDGFGVLDCALGDEIGQMMARFGKLASS